MKIALAQINPTVGDLAGNVERCLAAINTAGGQEAGLVVLPELVIPGYPPRDILFDPSFTEAVTAATLDLAQQARGGPPILLGTLIPAERRPPHHPGLYNAAVLLNDGKVHLVAAKRLLPAYDVFFEPRWFLPGPALPPLDLAGRRLGVLLCEDMWDEEYDLHPPAELRSAGADILVVLSASPYRRQVLARRLYHARRCHCPVIYVNLCGATDELIFDGRSFVLDQGGEMVTRLAGFEEDVRVIDLEEILATSGGKLEDKPISYLGQNGTVFYSTPPDENPEEELYRALVMGVRDFARKNGLAQAVVGLSGGIDSALAAIIAAEALGPERVTTLALPSRYTDPRSTQNAQKLAQALGLHFKVIELEGLHSAAETTLGGLLAGGTAAENIQARLRAVILMSYVNRYGGMLLNSSNKTELALGYATLYGDMAGALCPLADITKPEVYTLARWINSARKVIPPFILERPPSAELRPDQVDPFDYPTVAPAMEELVRENRSDLALRRSEHKRWQMGVILKVSEKAFGTGRLMPITRR